MSDPDIQRESDIAIVQKAVDGLGEHFDTVQIFVTRHEPERKESQTVSVHLGAGNWHARFGQVLEWVAWQDELARAHIRKESL